MQIWNFKQMIPTEEREQIEAENLTISRKIGLSKDLSLEEKGLLLYLYSANSSGFVSDAILKETGIRIARLEFLVETLQDKGYLRKN